MDGLVDLGGKLINHILTQRGFELFLTLSGLVFFAFLYFREKNRNSQLTNLMLSSSEQHANKFVGVVTESITADNRLALSITQLTTTIHDIKTRLDNLVGMSNTSYRR